ncbi:MAG: hypothetical protein QXQ18_00165 [Candidatus Aenigmatarchaeota archaeon]
MATGLSWSVSLIFAIIIGILIVLLIFGVGSALIPAIADRAMSFVCNFPIMDVTICKAYAEKRTVEVCFEKEGWGQLQEGIREERKITLTFIARPFELIPIYKCSESHQAVIKGDPPILSCNVLISNSIKKQFRIDVKVPVEVVRPPQTDILIIKPKDDPTITIWKANVKYSIGDSSCGVTIGDSSSPEKLTKGESITYDGLRVTLKDYGIGGFIFELFYSK